MHGRVVGHGVPSGKDSPTQVRNDQGSLLEVFTVVLFRVLGPKLCLEEFGLRLRVQVQGRLYDMLWGLGPRNMGSRAQALYRGPNSRTMMFEFFIK